MKLASYLFRAATSLAIAFAISLSSSVIYFNYTSYENPIDRYMMVGGTMLGFGYLFYLAFPHIVDWLKGRNIKYLLTFGLFAVIVSMVTVFPTGTSRVYWLGMGSFALGLFALMSPAIPALERIKSIHSPWHYLISFLVTLGITYGMMGLLSGTMYERHHVMFFAGTLSLLGTVPGTYIVRRASHSLKNGFLNNPLNIFLVFLPPVFFGLILWVSLQFPTMFPYGYILLPRDRVDLYLCSSIVAAAWGILLLEQLEKHGIYRQFRQTKVFTFIKENLPGIYAGFVIFLVNLILARAINSLGFNIHSIIFEADAEPWLAILGYPEGEDVNRAVHPLMLITWRPFTRFIGLFMGDNWFLAPMISIALISGVSITMAWVFIKRAVQNDTYAFIFSMLFGVTASHLLFGSITETYVFGMATLVYFMLLIQADEKRFSVLVPAGLMVFGVTITNIGQSVIGLFFKKFGFWRLVKYGIVTLALGIALTAFVSMVYPNNQTFFYVPQDIAFETRFSEPVYTVGGSQLKTRAEIVTKNMFQYGILGPTPVEVYTNKQAGEPKIKYLTYRAKDNLSASYDGLANIPLALWMIALAAAVFQLIKNFRSNETPLLLSLLGGMAFNFILHMNYGDEIFLYTSYYTFLVVFFVAAALKDMANKKWIHYAFTIFLLMTMVNNINFIHVIMEGLAPYYAK